MHQFTETLKLYDSEEAFYLARRYGVADWFMEMIEDGMPFFHLEDDALFIWRGFLWSPLFALHSDNSIDLSWIYQDEVNRLSKKPVKRRRPEFQPYLPN